MAQTSKATVTYNYLGRSGLRVSNIGLGAMTLCKGSQNFPSDLSEEKDAHRMLDRYAELGGNFIDTANIYGSGKSETHIGSWLKNKKREDFVIATKVRFGSGETTGLSRRAIITEIEKSLSRLQTDYVDLYQIHCWDSATPIEETAMALDDLVKSGRVRYIGASNFTGWQLQKYMDMCKYMGLHRFISLQPQYSLLVRESEFEVIDVCKNEGLGVIPWAPLTRGLLTGKYSKGALDDATGRVAFASNHNIEFNSLDLTKTLNDERTWTILEKLDSIAKEHGKTVSQVSLRWLLQKPFVSSVIVGSTKLEQLEQNMGASGGWELSQEEMKELDGISQPVLPYPYEMIARMNKGRINPYNK